MTEFDLRKQTILLVVSGSRAYGLHRDDSDVDLKGVAVPPLPVLLGAVSDFQQVDEAGRLDVFQKDLSDEERASVARTKLEGTVYAIGKFFRLAAQANPNILEILFCREDEIRLMTGLGRKLRENRRMFLSARAKQTFSGYAASQLKRIRTHRRWLLQPPDREPTRADHHLPERTLIPGDQLAAAGADIRKKVDSWEIDFGALAEAEKIRIQDRVGEVLAELGITSDSRWKCAARSLGYSENFIALLDRERRYEAARREWEQYQNWKRSRNPKRARLEQEYGYDTQHAVHLVRLLRMCRELLTTGEFEVWRGDRDVDELRAVQKGAWSYEELIARAEDENQALDEICARKDYRVPRSPDTQAIDRLCQSLVADFHRIEIP